MLLLGGCIAEDRSDCPPQPEGNAVLLRVADAQSGEDLTADGAVRHAELFLFGPDGAYVGRYAADEVQIAGRIPVPVAAGDLAGYRISVWGNAGTEQQFDESFAFIGDEAIALPVGNDGFRVASDDLFFGIGRFGSPAEQPLEVTLLRKNARLRITVRGLDARVPAENYYFTVKEAADGYDFLGMPSGNPALLRCAGAYDAHGDFVSADPFDLIHTEGSAEGAVTVSLYRKEPVRTDDRLVVAVTTDDDGAPLELPSGRTTHLLIDLRGTQTEIRVEVTRWGEMYQWDAW